MHNSPTSIFRHTGTRASHGFGRLAGVTGAVVGLAVPLLVGLAPAALADDATAAAVPSPSASSSTASSSAASSASSPTAAATSGTPTTGTPTTGTPTTSSPRPPVLRPVPRASNVAAAVPRAMAVSFPADGPGPVGRPIDTLAVSAATATYTPCNPGGPTAADQALASSIRPWLTGTISYHSSDQLAEAVSCARVIVATVQANRMDRQAAVIALATTTVESSMRNVTYGDRDSLGLYQQRPSQGWGSAAQVQDPVYATNAFLAAMRRNFPNDVWQTRQVGVVAQGVQISAFPDRYEPQAADAVQLVSRLWVDPSELTSYVSANGRTYRSAPANCVTEMCSVGSTMLDSNPGTSGAVVGYGTYEFQARTGQVWRSTGAPCTSTGCRGWVQLSTNPRTTTVAAGLGGVYMFQASTGYLYQFTGSPCVSSCTGWRLIDKNPATTRVVVNKTGVYQFQGSTGQLWRFTGQPCGSSSTCTGWQLAAAKAPGTTVVLGPASVVAFDRYTGRTSVAENLGCTTTNCFSWRQLDTDPKTTQLVSTTKGLFKYAASTHQVARYTGSGWVLLDRNPSTTQLYAGPSAVYQVHGVSGEVWSWTGATCSGSSCPGWVRITVRPGTTAVYGTGT